MAPRPTPKQQTYSSQWKYPNNRPPSTSQLAKPRPQAAPSSDRGVRTSLQDFSGNPFQSYLNYQKFQNELDSEDVVADHSDVQRTAQQQWKEYQKELQMKEYQQRNHPTNLNNYLIKVIVSPREIKVLEGSDHTPLSKHETETISSTSSMSVLIHQLTDRLKAAATGVTGDCPPRIENIATYLRTVQYYVRNKAEDTFWPYFANASSSGSITSFYVEQSPDARPIVNQNQSRVNPAQFWYEARRTCSEIDLSSEGIMHLIYLFALDPGAQNAIPSEILVIVHEGLEDQQQQQQQQHQHQGIRGNSKVSGLSPATSISSSLTQARNRASQNLDKVLQEYIETEKRLTGTSVFHHTVLSHSNSSIDSPAADNMLYDQSLKEFEVYMNIPPPVPEKENTGYFSTVMNKARQLKRSVSIRSTRHRQLEEDSTGTKNSSKDSLSSESNSTLPTKLTDSDETVDKIAFDSNASEFSFTPEKTSVLDVPVHKQKALLPQPPQPEAPVAPAHHASHDTKSSTGLRVRMKRWLTLFLPSALHRPNYKDMEPQFSENVDIKFARRRRFQHGSSSNSSDSSIVNKPTRPTRSRSEERSIANKYLLTELGVIEGAISPNNSSKSTLDERGSPQPMASKPILLQHPNTAPTGRSPYSPIVPSPSGYSRFDTYNATPADRSYWPDMYGPRSPTSPYRPRTPQSQHQYMPQYMPQGNASRPSTPRSMGYQPQHHQPRGDYYGRPVTSQSRPGSVPPQHRQRPNSQGYRNSYSSWIGSNDGYSPYPSHHAPIPRPRSAGAPVKGPSYSRNSGSSYRQYATSPIERSYTSVYPAGGPVLTVTNGLPTNSSFYSDSYGGREGSRRQAPSTTASAPTSRPTTPLSQRLDVIPSYFSDDEW